jgi:hypothetical protein
MFTNDGDHGPFQIEGLPVSSFELWFQFVDGIRSMESKSIQQFSAEKLFKPVEDDLKGIEVKILRHPHPPLTTRPHHHSTYTVIALLHRSAITGTFMGPDDRHSVCPSCPGDVLSSAPGGSPDSASRARRLAPPSPGWRSYGNGRRRLPHSPALFAPRWPHAADEQGSGSRTRFR